MDVVQMGYLPFAIIQSCFSNRLGVLGLSRPKSHDRISVSGVGAASSCLCRYPGLVGQGKPEDVSRYARLGTQLTLEQLGPR